MTHRHTIVREPAGWPSYREQFVVLRPDPENWTMVEVARFGREHEAIAFRNAKNKE